MLNEKYYSITLNSTTLSGKTDKETKEFMTAIDDFVWSYCRKKRWPKNLSSLTFERSEIKE